MPSSLAMTRPSTGTPSWSTVYTRGARTSMAKLTASSFSSRCSPRCSPTLAHRLARPGLSTAPTLARSPDTPARSARARRTVAVRPLDDHRATGSWPAFETRRVGSGVRVAEQIRWLAVAVVADRHPIATGAPEHSVLPARSRARLTILLWAAGGQGALTTERDRSPDGAVAGRTTGKDHDGGRSQTARRTHLQQV